MKIRVIKSVPYLVHVRHCNNIGFCKSGETELKLVLTSLSKDHVPVAVPQS